jgi:hypothetical protein
MGHTTPRREVFRLAGPAAGPGVERNALRVLAELRRAGSAMRCERLLQVFFGISRLGFEVWPSWKTQAVTPT